MKAIQLVLVLVAIAVAGCASRREKVLARLAAFDRLTGPNQLAGDDALFEAGFREAFLFHTSKETIFIAVKPAGAEKSQDPSPALLENLCHLGVNAKPASLAEYRNRVAIYDPSTGRRVSIQTVSIQERLSDTQVLLEISDWYDPLGASGEETEFNLRAGTWVAGKSRSRWVS